MTQPVQQKELRDFGLIVGGVFAVIGLWPMVFRGEDMRLWALGLGGTLIAAGLVFPTALRLPHQGWMWGGHVLGWINTRIILGIVFFGLVTPMGVVMRLFGKDSMHRAFVQDVPTYRVVRGPRPREHMRNQF